MINDNYTKALIPSETEDEVEEYPYSALDEFEHATDILLGYQDIVFRAVYSELNALIMNNNSISRVSETDWEALDKMTDDEIDLSDIPEVTAEQMARAKLRVGGKPISKSKMRVNIYDVIDQLVQSLSKQFLHN